MKITKMLGIVAAAAIVSGSAFATKNLTDTWRAGVVDSQKVCVITAGGVDACGSYSCNLKLNFGSNSSSLLSYDHACLRERAAEAKANKRVSIIGHTDNVGNDKFNMNLSKKRATTVASLLRRLGVSNITVLGKGESSPIASNATNSGRAKNRRVEMR